MRTENAFSQSESSRRFSPVKPLYFILSMVFLFFVFAPNRATAGGNDLVMSRLGNTVGNGVIGSNLDFRSLTSQLGVVFAPRLQSPADTLGFSGFQFSTDLSFTTIDADAPYWRAREEEGSNVMPTFSFFARKGIWLPLPSCEIGLGAVHLSDSQMWAAQGYIKFAILEGYHDLPLPSIAIRGAASRVFGSRDLDITLASIDVSISKHVGIDGTFGIEPYIGWNYLINIPRSDVVDKTPHIANDWEMNFVFKDQDNIIRTRIFLGMKAQYHVFTFTAQASFALPGSSTDDREVDVVCTSDSTTYGCNSTDEAASQQTYTLSLGLDF